MGKLPAPPENCPLCGVMWSAINEHNNAHCYECDMDWSDMENFHHVGQWMDVDGEPVHVLADPNMSEATRHALEELARAARKYVENLKPDMEALKKFDAALLVETLEHYLTALNFDIGRNVEPERAGWEIPTPRPISEWQVMYALRDAELLEMQDVRDSRGWLTDTEYRITKAGIDYLRSAKP